MYSVGVRFWCMYRSTRTRTHTHTLYIDTRLTKKKKACRSEQSEKKEKTKSSMVKQKNTFKKNLRFRLCFIFVCRCWWTLQKFLFIEIPGKALKWNRKRFLIRFALRFSLFVWVCVSVQKVSIRMFDMSIVSLVHWNRFGFFLLYCYFWLYGDLSWVDSEIRILVYLIQLFTYTVLHISIFFVFDSEKVISNEMRASRDLTRGHFKQFQSGRNGFRLYTFRS